MEDFSYVHMIEANKVDNSLWEAYQTTLYRFALKRVDNPATAEDIVQDVLIKVYKRLDILKDQEKIWPWMYQMTRNTIIDYYRKHKPTDEIEETTAVVETLYLEENVEKELAHCLLPMVNQLPAGYQQAIKMAEFEGLTQKEVAQQQGLSLSGAKSRIQRGRKLLKEKLLDCCPIEFDHQGQIFNYDCKTC